MKKKIFLGLLLGALSFGSCVKDNESEAVKKQRDAQAELLLADANLKNKQAEVQAAEAEIKAAKAELDKALKESEVRKHTASSTAAWAEAEVTVEKKKLEKEKLVVTFNAELEAQKAKIEGLKVERVQNLVTAVSSATTLYSNAVSSVVQKENQITNTEVSIAKLKAGVVTATAAKDKLLAEENSKIKKAEIKKAALEEAISSNFTNLDKLREDLSKKENEKDQAKATFGAEYKRVDAFYKDETSDYKKAKSALSSLTEMYKLEFFKNVKELYEVVKETESEARAKKVTPNYTPGHAFAVTGTDRTETYSNTTFIIEKATVKTKAELQDKFFSQKDADFSLDELKLKVSDAETKKDKAVSNLEDAEKEYKAAQKSLTLDTASQTLINNFNTAKQNLLTKRNEKDTKEGEWNKLKEKQKKFEDAVVAIKKGENQDAVLAHMKKFFDQQTELENKLKKLEELKDKYDALNDEYDALKESSKAIAEVNLGGNINNGVVDELLKAINDADKDISDAKANIEKYTDVRNAEELLRIEKDKLKEYKDELEVLKKKLGAAKKVYENAVKALEEAMKNSSNS